MSPRPSSAARRFRVGLRARMLFAYVGLLAVAGIASVLVARQVLLVRLEERIDRELAQEVSELRLLARGRDPQTGRPFGTDVRRVFDVFIQRNIPARNEVLITYVDGRPYRRSPSLRAPPYRLERDRELTARWGSLARSDTGEISTPGGRVRFLAVPVRIEGAPSATFAAVVFRDREEEELNDAIIALAGVGLALLVAGSVLAWRLAGGVLRPVRAVTSTARSITATSLEGRIPEQGGDEIAQLAATFNEMLDRLERAFAAQRDFLDDAGHELRTPLTIVRGHLETLEEDPDARRRTVELVLDEVKRMGRMIDDLILLAQSDEPDFLRVEPVDVAALTNDLYEKARALGGRSWRIDAVGRGIIVADGQRLTQAVMQLAQNAVEHTDVGAEIGLGSTVTLEGARFWVRDTGSGVAAGDRERIFERLERGSNEDRPGTDVSRILIAEDEERIALFIERGLKARGYATEVVRDGASALSRARSGRFDLMILDLGLPEQDGLDVLRALRHEGTSIAVVILTARSSVRELVHGFEVGADDYITKPFSFDELLVRVRARLHRDRAPELPVLRVGDAELDVRTRSINVDGRTVELSAREFGLAEMFFQHPGQVLSREQLLSRVWGYDFDPGSNVVDVYVGYLRKKLGKERIVNARGMGYRLEAKPGARRR